MPRNNEERKEKAKDAARNRRTEEGDYFEVNLLRNTENSIFVLQELEKLLPVSGPPPSSQQTSLDKTSIIRLSITVDSRNKLFHFRLSVAHLRTQDVIRNGMFILNYLFKNVLL